MMYHQSNLREVAARVAASHNLSPVVEPALVLVAVVALVVATKTYFPSVLKALTFI